MNDQALRDHLRKLLGWEDAHVHFNRAIDGFPAGLRGRKPEGLPHTPWQLLEHLRLTQFDILDFCRNPRYVELSSMEEYWPKSDAPADDQAWEESVAAFRRDLEAIKQLAMDPSIDLFARVPQGTGQTFLREILLVADHNAYHVGQIVDVRRALGAW
ncbi:MAG TPA: DinB family protein, partial [Thermoanaerobaculia bacterium]